MQASPENSRWEAQHRSKGQGRVASLGNGADPIWRHRVFLVWEGTPQKGRGQEKEWRLAC